MDNQNISQNIDENSIKGMQNKLIEDLGISDLPKDQQQELIVKMTEVVLKRIFLETLEKLSEEDKKKYEEMIENNSSPEEIDSFLKDKIANYDTMVERIIQEFKVELKEGLNKN